MFIVRFVVGGQNEYSLEVSLRCDMDRISQFCRASENFTTNQLYAGEQ
jgi:hypothetical protein